MTFPRSSRNAMVFRLVLFFLLSVTAMAQQPAAPTPPPAAAQQPAGVSAQPIPPEQSGFDVKAGVPIYETIQEDWSSLQIGVSKLTPEPPLEGPREEKDKFTRQLVGVKWRPGDRLDLWVAMPKGVKNPPVVLYLYNYTEGTDRFRNDAWCERVTGGGVAAVGFVSALSGPRFHDRPMKQWFISEMQESLGSTVHDVKFILDYLASRGDMDMTRVGMFGQGSGGAIAVLAAAADPRIKAIDLLEPWGDWPHFLATSSVVKLDLEPDKYAKPDFLKTVAPLDPVKWLPDLKIPIRMQQVKDDDAVPMESKDALKNAAPKQTEVLRFATALAMYHAESGGNLFSWVKDRLNTLSSTAPAVAQQGPNSSSAPAPKHE